MNYCKFLYAFLCTWYVKTTASLDDLLCTLHAKNSQQENSWGPSATYFREVVWQSRLPGAWQRSQTKSEVSRYSGRDEKIPDSLTQTENLLSCLQRLMTKNWSSALCFLIFKPWSTRRRFACALFLCVGVRFSDNKKLPNNFPALVEETYVPVIFQLSDMKSEIQTLYRFSSKNSDTRQL